MGHESQAETAVAIVTGGSSGAGREIALALVAWRWPVVIVYLDLQPAAEATVAELIAAGGTVIAVRADLSDDLDVQRMYTESITEFGVVDAVVHTTTDDPGLLCRHGARYLRQQGTVAITSAVDSLEPSVASALGDRHITVVRAPPDDVLALLAGWRHQTPG